VRTYGVSQIDLKNLNNTIIYVHDKDDWETSKTLSFLNLNTVGYYQRMYWKDSGKDESLRYKDELLPGDVVFDLGAFEGEFTERTLKEGVNYYLFDTNPKMIELLTKKFKNNVNVHIFPFGLGDRDMYGESTKSILPWASAGASFREKDGTDFIIRQFSSFIDEMKISKIDLLKSNIEGAEYSLFNHMDEIDFIKNIKSIQVQPHDFDNKATKDLLNLHRIMHKTHKLKLSYPFVWDFWHIK